MGADTAVLMHARKRSHGRVVFNRNVACERRRIGHNDMTTQGAVVPNMDVRHKEIMIPYSGVPAAAFGSTMNIHILAKDVVVADRKKRFFTLELEVLRLESDGSEWVELIVLADRRRPFDDHVGFETATIPNLHAAADTAVRTDAHIGA